MDNLDPGIERKVRYRLLPFLFIIYFVAFLDRSSITYASLGGMDAELGLTSTFYGFVAGIFFIGYFLFGVPGNMLLEKVGARKWIGIILLLWGAVTVATGFVHSATMLVILRFLLGVFEAALFPGMTLITTYWFVSVHRAAAVAMFMVAPPLANAIGAPVAMTIIDYVHNFIGLAGWRWLFVIVGLPAIVLGLITFKYLDDDPSQAKWLTIKERQSLVQALDADKLKNSTSHGVIESSFKAAFKNRKVWIVTLMNVFYVVGLYGITFFLPKIIASLIQNASDIQVGLLTAIPYLLGAVSLVVTAKISDKLQKRKIFLVGATVLAGLSLIAVSIFQATPLIAFIFIIFGTLGVYAWSGPYWAISTQLDPRIAAVGLGIINALGNLGGFVGPYTVGALNDITGTQMSGVVFLAVSLILAGLMTMFLKEQDNNGGIK
ncbi:MFS transporter [Weissella coleopterorum]|uniref:MFS transporter n=1 Tax=Weissella coleopterorum TaxID=2714949 RepID=A0A6G8AYW7_9LACO|nr:MFS transporter [Weissella coleopterorum]QIL50155.1 MFS transporter [Weissella coleopterorum]